MRSKLGIYVIGVGDITLDWFRIAQPRVAVTMDANRDFWRAAKDVSPSTFLVQRFYVDDGEQHFEYKERADEFFVRARPDFERLRGIADAVMGYNESAVFDVDTAKRLSDFYARFGDLCRGDGLKSCAYSFSTGHPGLELWPHLAEGLRHCDYLALHEYSAPRMETQVGWQCLRYRKVWEALPADARRPLIITECGIDGGVIDRPQQGWRAFGDVKHYLDSLKWYDRELQRDDYVLGAAIFAARWDKGERSYDMASETTIRDYIAGGGASGTSPPTDDGTAIAIDFIKRWEGFTPVPKPDAKGKQTIGYGHTIQPNEKFTVITEAQGLDLLDKDIVRYANAVRESVKVALTPNQFGPLVSLAYNIGVGAFKDSDLVAKLNGGDARSVPSEFVRWRWSEGKEKERLFLRRCDEAREWLGFPRRSR